MFSQGKFSSLIASERVTRLGIYTFSKTTRDEYNFSHWLPRSYPGSE